MRTSYNFLMHAYELAIRLASPFNRKALLWVKGRNNLFAELKASLEKEKRKIAWFHCASLGEFEQGRPVIETYRKNHPGHAVLLTFYSPSGYEVRKHYEHADYVYYLPHDTPGKVKKFLRLVQPDFAVFVKYEFWFNYLRQLKKQNIPVYLISAVFRKEHHFFKPYGAWQRKHLHFFKHIFLQDESSSRLLQQHGIMQTTVAGDTRFDRVREVAQNPKHIESVKAFSKESITVVAGSTWPVDEKLICSYINDHKTNDKLKWVIAPHEVDQGHITELQRKIEQPVQLFSTAEAFNPKARVMIIDSIGMLGHIYQYGDIAYIGGGLGKGIHNILEPAAFGLPVIFGPEHRKFREAGELIHKGGAFEVEGEKELFAIFDQLTAEKDLREKSGNCSETYIHDHAGATRIITKKISSGH